MLNLKNILKNQANSFTKLPIAIIIILLLLFHSFPAKTQIFINEFLAKGNTTLQDPDEPGDYPDWIDKKGTAPSLRKL